MTKGYTAYVLTEASRENLLKLFPPTYSNVVAHHVTWMFGVDETTELPPQHRTATIREIVDDQTGVEALIVNIDGNSIRPDGKTLHVTWSLADGRKPVESNDAIKHGVRSVIVGLVTVELEPKFISF